MSRKTNGTKKIMWDSWYKSTAKLIWQRRLTTCLLPTSSNYPNSAHSDGEMTVQSLLFTSCDFGLHPLHLHPLSNTVQFWSSVVTCLHASTATQSLHVQVDEPPIEYQDTTTWHSNSGQVKAGGLETKIHYVNTRTKVKDSKPVWVSWTFPPQWLREQRHHIAGRSWGPWSYEVKRQKDSVSSMGKTRQWRVSR